VRWYLRHGYEIVERNWRHELGEIDLIVARPSLVVFVEVKARADDRFGPAAGAVGPEKQRRIRLLATRWLEDHPDRRGPIRFDVVAVTGTRVEVIEAAF
jgi:putative endonuclease